MIKITLEKEPLTKHVGVLAISKSKNTKEGYWVILKFSISPSGVKHETASPSPGDMSYFPVDFLQALFDAMWSFGFRPTEGKL